MPNIDTQIRALVPDPQIQFDGGAKYAAQGFGHKSCV